MGIKFWDDARMKEAIQECYELIDEKSMQEYDSEWAGPVTECDNCGELITRKTAFFADAEMFLDEGIWGILCPVCLISGGNEMVWGRGQLYHYVTDQKRWRLVAGFPPVHMR